MHRNRPTLVFGLLGLAALSLCLWAADEYWKKPLENWTREEAEEMLTDSPWAKSFVLATDTGRKPMPSESIGASGPASVPVQAQGSLAGSLPPDIRAERGRGGDVPGEREIFDAYRVRLFSALPIRQAHLRKMQLDSGYDQMNAFQRDAFDRKTERATSLDVSDRIIVSLEFESNDRGSQMEVNRKLRELTTDQLKQSAYLITERFERLELQEYYPPSPDGSGVKFIYPRKLNGEPVVSSDDSELKFEFFVPGTTQKLYIIWKVNELQYGGELAL